MVSGTGGVQVELQPPARSRRPRVMKTIVELILQMALENPSWGYTRIRGALARSRARRTPPMVDDSEGSLGVSGGHRLPERRSLYDEGSRHAVRTVLCRHRLPIRTRRRHYPSS